MVVAVDDDGDYGGDYNDCYGGSNYNHDG